MIGGYAWLRVATRGYAWLLSLSGRSLVRQVRSFFGDLFRSADTQDAGVLFYQDIIELMRQADLGLSTVQIHMVISEAVQDEEGYINYMEFADLAGGIFVNMMDLDRHAEFKNKVMELRDRYGFKCEWD